MCGITGIINKTPRAFDYETFCTLGIANDTRGGDSCGIFIDGKYEYGIGKNSLFANFFQESKLINETKTATISLAHCRKASIGKVSLETAQPVIIEEDGKVTFVVMHNGTIHNYEDLAKKYIPEIDIKGMTDSQVMARIFYHKGYDVLSEYNGGAVFAIVDYRTDFPKVFLFKGASRKASYSIEPEEERPLYYCIDQDKQELVFSSIWTYLMALRRNCEVYSMKVNELVEFTGTSLATVSKINRSKMQQNKEIYFSSYDKNYFSYNDWKKSYYNDAPSSCIYVDFSRNLYLNKGKKVHGKLSVSTAGIINSRYIKNTELWFFNGVALKNEKCFKFLNKLMERSQFTITEFSNKFENIIRFLSIDGIYPRGEFWYKAISPVGNILYTGTLQPLTTSSVITYAGGVKLGISTTKTLVPIESKASNKIDINFKEILKGCMSLMK